MLLEKNMGTESAIMLIVCGVGLFPWVLRATIDVVRFRFRTSEDHAVIEWALFVLTFVSGALLLHWIPRLGELWAKMP